jgi:Tfp pilus assembly protein PilF/TolB-like protein
VQPGTCLGPYEIVAQIGAGGMGEVYRARDTRLGRDVAIKVLPADFAVDAERLKRFEREAKATAALSHPNILAVYDVGTHEGVPYLVEELLEGESLRTRLAWGPVPVRDAAGIAGQVAHGLAAAHEKHIVHRDLKPENVFLTREGTVKILDFGLAKLVEGAPLGEADTLTQAPPDATGFGRVLGTMAYMAPEQARGIAVDERADIFAFGVVLYEMLAGVRPFRGETATDTVAAILKEEPPPLPEGVPAALQAVLAQCLAKRPDQRFTSGHDLESALQAASSQRETAIPMRAGAGVAGSARRLRLLLFGGVLAAVAVVATLVIWHPWHGVSKPAGSNAERTPTILALPCKVYGAPEVAFLTDAVPGTISTLLAQVDGLDTKVPPTSFEVEKVKGDLGQLGELYQVSSFIVTSINASAAGFALNVQLVDAATRKVRWGKQYEGTRDAYNDLARQAAEGIRLAVKPAAPPVPTSGVSSEAELAFREGMYSFDRYSQVGRVADFENAVTAFKRALALDPSFAAAAAKVAELYAGRLGMDGDVHDWRKQAESWAHRAFGIDPRCGEAWAALSMAEFIASHADAERGIDHAVKAVAFAPRDAWVHMNLGLWMSNGGSSALGVATSLRALELDPFLFVAAVNGAWGLCSLRRAADALVVLDPGLRVQPEWPWGLLVRALALTQLGRLEEAESTLRRCEQALKQDHTASESWREERLALAVAQRDTATSEALVPKILATVLDSRADALLVGNAAGTAAPTLAHMGRTNDAMRILEKSVEVGVPQPYDWLLVDPDIQLLRSDWRFAKVLAASRDRAAMVARILEQARARSELPSYLNQPLDELVKLLSQQGGTSQSRGGPNGAETRHSLGPA